MSFHYILYERAQSDYEAPIKWYFEKSPTAAKGFRDAMDNALKLVCDNPTRWRNTYKHYYELGLKKYPFVVIYSIEADVQIVAVWKIYHHKKNPQKKYRQLRKS